VSVDSAAPKVDVHAADPRVRVTTAAPTVEVAAWRPKVDVHELTVAEIAEEPAGLMDFSSASLSRAELRRAVILSEVFRPPLAIRGPGGLPLGAL
jgi:hypothetical protein